MNLRFGFFLCLLFTLSANSFALTQKEARERLKFIEGELSTIQNRIKEGQSPDLFKKFIDEFEAEKATLRAQLKSSPEVESPPKAKRERRSRKAKRNKRSNKSSDGLRPVVVLKEKDKGKRFDEIQKLKKRQREDYLYLVSRGRRGRPLRQIQTNLAYLELEEAKITGSRGIAQAKSGGSALSYRGHMQFRTESAVNRQGSQGTRQSEQSFFRFRTYFTFTPNSKLNFNFTPQATKTFGGDDEIVALQSDGTTLEIDPVVTSGSTNHTEVDFYEANLQYKLFDPLTVKLGRQEVAYGDHLIIGSLPWANTARSFDALKARYQYSLGWSDMMYSKISDHGVDGSALSSNDDTDLFLIYNSWNINQYFKPLELYFIHLDNDNSDLEVNTLGMRLKGSVGSFFYRTENGVQSGANLGEDAFQYNVEVGGKFAGYSASLEYAVAGHDYRQLYPTAHKFLGFADVLGRRNVKHTAFHVKGGIFPWLGARLDYHIFKRNDTAQPAYNLLANTSRGTTGTSDDIGSELDLVLTFKTSDQIKLQLGGAWFSPGEYMRDQDASNRDDTVRFLYAQVNATF